MILKYTKKIHSDITTIKFSLRQHNYKYKYKYKYKHNYKYKYKYKQCLLNTTIDINICKLFAQLSLSVSTPHCLKASFCGKYTILWWGDRWRRENDDENEIGKNINWY